MVRLTRGLIVVVLAFAVGTFAQNSPPQHRHDDNVIDGAKNPELIPDATAFRLWLVTASVLPNATGQERAAQKAHLSRVGLRIGSTDEQALQTILTEFKSQYTTLINRYNETATADLARGIQPDQSLFLQQRDDLVATTRTAITSRLSRDGAALVNAHVQSEKKNMQLHTPKGAQ